MFEKHLANPLLWLKISDDKDKKSFKPEKSKFPITFQKQ